MFVYQSNWLVIFGSQFNCNISSFLSLCFDFDQFKRSKAFGDYLEGNYLSHRQYKSMPVGFIWKKSNLTLYFNFALVVEI